MHTTGRGCPVEEMPKNYDPQTAEPELIERWMSAGCYQRSKGVGDCTVVIPPPNVTGILHMGHAMDDSIQDTYVRYSRMRGRSTRWILGTDHAGIATQTKVDKKLKSEGVSRLEIGRSKFLDACWDWTREYGGTIVSQIKRMGCSIDFSDEKFTMSPEFSRAVRKVFCDWYHDGLIYRGKRIVNWCPSCCTAISDDEAEYQDEKGHLWYLQYPLVEPVDGIDHITVATTRPETMLGDTGVAVSPQDPEKAKLVGKMVRLPIVDREIPIFSDWHVDAGFGTGFVKVTPAHDPNDYAMGQAHDLPQINIFDEHAVVVDGYGEFSGMNRDQCREAVVAWFEEHGLLEKVEELDHSVMHCYRCNTALEPWLSEQWFVAVDKLKERATQVVRDGEVKFHPERWTQTYLTWMDNLKDWCISRQLWWGHRIPVFYCEDCGWEDALMEDTDVCPKCGGHHVHQDEDVLDTWFSSQLWTFATQGWPDDTSELAEHHPTKVLVTARDIIALWVARMIMSSLYFTALPRRLHLRHDPGQGRQPHVQVQGQRRGPDGAHGEVRCRRHALQPPHAHHQQPGRQVRRQHRQEDAQAHRQPAHGAGPRLRDQDLEREPLRPDEPRGLRAGRSGRRHARGRVDAVAPRARRRACHRAAGDLCLRRLRSRDPELLLGRRLRLVHRALQEPPARRCARGAPAGPAQPRLRARHLHEAAAPGHAVRDRERLGPCRS